MKKIKGLLYTNRWYFLIIFVGAALILLFNIFVFKPYYPNYNLEIWEIFMWTAIDIVAVFLGFGIDAALTRWLLPKKCFNPYNKNYKVSPKEKARLEKCGIKKWKDKCPEMGQYLIGFAKNEIKNPNDSEYMYKFVVETCYAEVMHGTYIALSFWILVLPWPITTGWLISLPVALVSSFLHLLPTLIQRYNRSKLIRIYEMQKAHEEKNNQNEGK